MKRVSVRLREAVVKRAFGCCEYCRSQAMFSSDTFSTEHIIPRHLGGETTLENLALSCQGCNNEKHTKVQALDPITGEMAPLYHPRKHRWHEHFVWEKDFTIIAGLTPTGRATVEALELNREGVINLRWVLYVFGKHPPDEPRDREE